MTVVYDLCFQGSTYDQHTITYEADGRWSQAVEAPAQAVGGDGPNQVVGRDGPDDAAGGVGLEVPVQAVGV
jgi:hypothetical protein